MAKFAAIAMAAIVALTIADMWAHAATTKQVIGFGTTTVNDIAGK